jgi:hypothetical protein
MFESGAVYFQYNLLLEIAFTWFVYAYFPLAPSVKFSVFKLPGLYICYANSNRFPSYNYQELQ